MNANYLINRLVELGCTRVRAAEVVKTALTDNVPADHLSRQISDWSRYCLSDRGKSIAAVGHFIAAKIEQDQLCPDFEAVTRSLKTEEWRRAVREVATEYVVVARQAGMAITTAFEQRARDEAELDQLYRMQTAWLDRMAELSGAAQQLHDAGYRSDFPAFAWNTSPYAGSIRRLEERLGV